MSTSPVFLVSALTYHHYHIWLQRNISQGSPGFKIAHSLQGLRRRERQINCISWKETKLNGTPRLSSSLATQFSKRHFSPKYGTFISELWPVIQLDFAPKNTHV